MIVFRELVGSTPVAPYQKVNNVQELFNQMGRIF